MYGLTLEMQEYANPAGSKGTYWPVAETAVDNTTADVENLTQAFKGTVFGDDENKTWKYGKINGKRTKTRLADIELKWVTTLYVTIATDVMVTLV